MATVIDSSRSRPRQTGQVRTFGAPLALVLATLAGTIVASGHRAFTHRVADAYPAAAPATTEAQPMPGSARSDGSGQGLAFPRVDQRNIEALSDAAARKYRISSDAMREYVAAAYAEARRNSLDPLLIIAVMAVESRFNPIAQSDFGATGLMQVIPQYHSDKFSAASGESVLDPHINIRVGARVLKEYIKRGGTEVAGLQLYNGARDTDNAYANKVMAERVRLREAMRRLGGRLDRSAA